MAKIIYVASVVLLDPINNMVLLGRRRDNGLLETPGGKLEPGETFYRAAVREMLEETGVSLDCLSYGGVMAVDKNGPHLIYHLLFSFNSMVAPKNLEPDKSFWWAWFPAGALPAPEECTPGMQFLLERLKARWGIVS